MGCHGQVSLDVLSHANILCYIPHNSRIIPGHGMLSYINGPRLQDVCSFIAFPLPYVCATFSVDNILLIISHLRFIKRSPGSLAFVVSMINLTLLAEHHYRVTQQYGGIAAIKQSSSPNRSTNRNMNHESKINVNKQEIVTSITFAVEESRGTDKIK